jgi:hypothetical protein
MTGPDTPAILLGPMWFHGGFERGRLVLHNGWVWFQPGTFVQEGGRIRFEPAPTSHSGFAVPAEQIRAKSPRFTFGCGLRLEVGGQVHRLWLGSARDMAGETDTSGENRGDTILMGNAFTIDKEAREAVKRWRAVLPSASGTTNRIVAAHDPQDGL